MTTHALGEGEKPMTREELRQLCVKATPGPWHAVTIGWILRFAEKSSCSCYDELPDDHTTPVQGDEEFIAAARAAVPELLEENEKLREALRLAMRWMGDPINDPIGTFEDIGDWFYRDTGFLRPGKSEPLECGGGIERDEERRDAWNKWTKRTGDHVRETCRAALRVGTAQGSSHGD